MLFLSPVQRSKVVAKSTRVEAGAEVGDADRVVIFKRRPAYVHPRCGVCRRPFEASGPRSRAGVNMPFCKHCGKHGRATQLARCVYGSEAFKPEGSR